MSLPRTKSLIVAELETAILETAWGGCGISWVAPRENAARGADASGCLLAQIVLPGLTPRDLREKLTQGTARREPQPCRAGPDSHRMPAWWDELAGLVQSYCAAEPAAWPGPRDLWSTWSPRLYLAQLTAFQRAVLEALCAVPSGQVVTYGHLAQVIGRPGAARAVGAALARNPWPLLVPCHRVLGGSGRLVGFSAPGGLTSKARMLAREGVMLGSALN